MLNNTVPIKANKYFQLVGFVYCASDESKPTPVYVVVGGKAVLQCGCESSSLTWDVDNIGSWVIIADGGDSLDESKYSTYKNPSTGLYYRLHILNVGVSDIKKYRCEGNVNNMIQTFVLQLILIGRCYCILVIL
jgi:hypothetical protein